jgi:hypothetical protein
MGDTRGVRDKDWGDEEASGPIVDEALADPLLARAEAEGMELLGPQGLLGQMTKAVLERAWAKSSPIIRAMGPTTGPGRRTRATARPRNG